MSQFKIHNTETAGPSKGLLEGAQKAFGFIPNLLAVMAESPALLEGYMTLSGIFDKSQLSNTERQIILMVNNRLNNCGYCMAAHTTIAGMQEVPKDVVESLRNGTPIADSKLEALRAFSVKMNESRGWPETKDIDALLAAGYTKKTVLEVVLGTGMKVLSNYTNHIAQTKVDSQFAANAWSKASQPV